MLHAGSVIRVTPLREYRCQRGAPTQLIVGKTKVRHGVKPSLSGYYFTVMQDTDRERMKSNLA